MKGKNGFVKMESDSLLSNQNQKQRKQVFSSYDIVYNFSKFLDGHECISRVDHEGRR